MNVPHLIVTTSRIAIKRLLVQMAPQLVAQIDWEANYREYKRDLEIAMSQAEALDRGQLRHAVKDIATLADEVGLASMRSIVANDPDMLAEFDAEPDAGSRAVWLFLEHESDFQHALAAVDADAKFPGRSASGYFIKASQVPDLDPEDNKAIGMLRRKLQDVKIDKPPNSNIGVTVFQRTMRDLKTGAERATYQLGIYVEGPSEAEAEPDPQGELHRRVRSHTVKAHALIDPSAKTIDVMIKGGEPVRCHLAGLIIDSFMPDNTELQRTERRQLHLDRFLSGAPFSVTADDPVEQIRVVSILLAPKGEGGGLLMLKRRDKQGHSDVYDASSNWFPGEDPLQSGNWTVISVDVRLFFNTSNVNSKKRAPVVTLTKPNRTNLHSLHEEERDYMLRSLEECCVYEPISPDDDLDEALIGP